VSGEGKIYSWGVGEQGQLGRKIMERHSHESSLRPRVINFRPGGRMSSKFTHAFCGSYHTFLVHESNTVYACGLNNYGQLGIGHFQEHEFEPEKVDGLENGIARIAGGEHHSMILDVNGN
jgi:regulator of chromosome condensation